MDPNFSSDASVTWCLLSLLPAHKAEDGWQGGAEGAKRHGVLGTGRTDHRAG